MPRPGSWGGKLAQRLRGAPPAAGNSCWRRPGPRVAWDPGLSAHAPASRPEPPRVRAAFHGGGSMKSRQSHVTLLIALLVGLAWAGPSAEAKNDPRTELKLGMRKLWV